MLDTEQVAWTTLASPTAEGLEKRAFLLKAIRAIGAKSRAAKAGGSGVASDFVNTFRGAKSEAGASAKHYRKEMGRAWRGDAPGAPRKKPGSLVEAGEAAAKKGKGTDEVAGAVGDKSSWMDDLGKWTKANPGKAVGAAALTGVAGVMARKAMKAQRSPIAKLTSFAKKNPVATAAGVGAGGLLAGSALGN